MRKSRSHPIIRTFHLGDDSIDVRKSLCQESVLNVRECIVSQLLLVQCNAYFTQTSYYFLLLDTALYEKKT